MIQLVFETITPWRLDLLSPDDRCWIPQKCFESVASAEYYAQTQFPWLNRSRWRVVRLGTDYAYNR